MSKNRNKRFWNRIKPVLAPGEERKIRLFQGESVRMRIVPTHKTLWIRTLRKSKAGVEHFFYRRIIVAFNG